MEKQGKSFDRQSSFSLFVLLVFFKPKIVRNREKVQNENVFV